MDGLRKMTTLERKEYGCYCCEESIGEQHGCFKSYTEFDKESEIKNRNGNIRIYCPYSNCPYYKGQNFEEYSKSIELIIPNLDLLPSVRPRGIPRRKKKGVK